MKIKHTPITITTVAKNGSERFGATASCNMYYTDNIKAEINQFGKTKRIAEEKLLKLLGNDREVVSV